MIWAGVVFLEANSNKSKEQILALPYPEFREMIAYLGDPEGFLKGGITQAEYDEGVKEAKRINDEMILKAIEIQKKQKEKEKAKGE